MIYTILVESLLYVLLLLVFGVLILCSCFIVLSFVFDGYFDLRPHNLKEHLEELFTSKANIEKRLLNG